MPKAKTVSTDSGQVAVTVIIHHHNTWDEAEHGVTFLGPLIAGVIKRLAPVSRMDGKEHAECK